MSEEVIISKKEIIDKVNKFGKSIDWEEAAIQMKEIDDEFRNAILDNNEEESTLFFAFLKAKRDYNARIKMKNKSKKKSIV